MCGSVLARGDEMIVKPYSKSLYLEGLVSLTKRLYPNSPKYVTVQEELKRQLAGSYGEEVVMNAMKKVELPYQHYVFHDVCLYGNALFQIDILIITQHYAVILEVKNIKGDVEIQNSPHQLIRTLPDGQKNSYESPVVQLNEAKYQLSKFLNHLNLPVYGAIVFAFASNHVVSPPGLVKILFKNEIRSFLREIPFNTPKLSQNQLTTLVNKILNRNDPFHPFPLKKHFEIRDKDIKKGAECLECNYIGVVRTNRKWFCPYCLQSNANVYDKALLDYFLIFNQSINNKELREYLGISGQYEATRLLNRKYLIKHGTYRDARYSMKLK